jgi:DNA-binding CsgD family transcriptional regulator
MASKKDPLRKKYGPLKEKNISNAIAHSIHKEFPRIGGPRIRNLCADMILDVIAEHIRPREYLTHGQLLWLAVSVDDPPRRHQRIADTDLVPVVLDLSLPIDIERRLERISGRQRLLEKALRLHYQSFEQGGLLSNCDVAEILCNRDNTISVLIAEHERNTGKIVPRRATVHDVGSGLTHKSIICLKRYRDGMASHEIARDTHHTIESVDRYLGQYDRVRLCRLQGMSPSKTATIIGCSLRLVEEYLDIDRQLEAAHDNKKSP